MVRHVFKLFSSGFASWNTGSEEDWIERNPFGFPLCFCGRFHQKRKWLNNPEHAICPGCQPPFHPALTVYTSRLTQPPLQRHIVWTGITDPDYSLFHQATGITDPATAFTR